MEAVQCGSKHSLVIDSCLQYSVSGGLCLQCLAGQFSAGNVSSCSGCVAGRFSGGGASSCTNCTAGSSSGGQASSCSVCGGGQVSDCVLMWHCGSSGHCVACVDWYGFNLVSLHTLSSLSCLSLPLQFSVSGGLCTACLAGQFSAGNVSSCSSCVAGTFSAAGASTCTNCSAGTSSVAQASSCSACGSGQVRVVVHRGLRRHVFLHCGVSSSIVAGGDTELLIAGYGG